MPGYTATVEEEIQDLYKKLRYKLGEWADKNGNGDDIHNSPIAQRLLESEMWFIQLQALGAGL